MKVSLIVPVFNVEKYIVRCLNSILHQTIVDQIELILVDDCGHDRSMEIAIEFLTNQSTLKYEIISHNKNRGLSAARNTGLDHASGDYVFFLDSDDEITNDCIERLVNPLRNFNYDIVVGDFESNGGKTECKLWLDTGPVLGNNAILSDFVNNRWYAMVWNKLYRREFIQINQLKFKEGIIHEDELWSFNVALYAQSMYVDKTVTYIYYINPGSIMRNMAHKRHLNSWAVIFLEMKHNASLIGRYDSYDVANYIESLKSNLTCEAFRCLDKKSFYEYYSILNQGDWNPIALYVKKKISYKRALKDLCFLLPQRIGFWYLCLWYNLTLKDL